MQLPKINNNTSKLDKIVRHEISLACLATCVKPLLSARIGQIRASVGKKTKMPFEKPSIVKATNFGDFRGQRLSCRKHPTTTSFQEYKGIEVNVLNLASHGDKASATTFCQGKFLKDREIGRIFFPGTTTICPQNMKCGQALVQPQVWGNSEACNVHFRQKISLTRIFQKRTFVN